MIGRKLSHFRILDRIGEGGMGVVYRAEDEKLQRVVALKVLPPERLADEERRLRFVREARTAAAVTHPNIAVIHEIDEADGIVFIAMELIEGKTLRDVTGGKPLPLREALRLGVEIAEGLSAAHQAKVIHRDLKPDNVIVTPGGHVKILDFGLAKLLDERGTAEPGQESKLATISGEMTQAGRVLGTAAYMSPEQARGLTLDARSDLFSFGIVLYEMVTGKAPFHGTTSMDTLTAILREQPLPAVQLNPEVPREMEWIIGKCLAKDPGERYQDTRDLLVDLKHLKRDTDSQPLRRPEGGPGAGPARPGRRRRVAFAIGAAAMALAVAGGYLAWRARRGPEAAGAAGPPRLAFTRLTSLPGAEVFPSLSPDGKTVAFAAREAGNLDILVLRVGGARAMNLTADSPADDSQPAFSPDGERIAFRSERDGGGIFVMGATGESVKRISDAGYNPAWSPDGKEIAWATEGIDLPFDRTTTSQIWALDLATGQRRLVFGGDAVQPQWSPHGRRIAYWSVTAGQRDIFTIPAAGGPPVAVTADAAIDWSPAWSADGRHLYFSSDRGGGMNLWRVPIDETSGKILGPPEPMTAPAPNAGHLSVAAGGGRIAYVARSLTSNIQRLSFDPVREKVEGDPAPITRGSRAFIQPDPSPDGTWVAFRTDFEQEDIFVAHPDGTGLRQVTDDPFRDRRPRWSPDGKRIAFYSNRSGRYEIWTVTPDGADLRQVTSSQESDDTDWPNWSPDGSRLVFVQHFDLQVLELTGGAQEPAPSSLPKPGTSGELVFPEDWSPDGKWLAAILYGSAGEALGDILYSFDSGSYERVTDSRGGSLCWLADSRRLLGAAGGAIQIMDRVTKDHREIYRPSAPGYVGQLSLSRDDRWIYFSLGTDEADVWIANFQ